MARISVAYSKSLSILEENDELFNILNWLLSTQLADSRARKFTMQSPNGKEFCPKKNDIEAGNKGQKVILKLRVISIGQR